MTESLAQILDHIEERQSPLVARFAAMLEPMAPSRLEALAKESQAVTRRNFGRTMRLFAPLYLSNECVNNCKYCGFSRDNPILRVTLSVDEVVREARALLTEGCRNILLGAGEHPRFISEGYLQECIAALHAEVPSRALDVRPREAPERRPLVAARR